MNNADKYNLHGHMIEYNKNNRTWTWSKWDYQQSGAKKQVVRRSGTLQFQKIFRSVVQGGEEQVNAHNSEDLEKSLEKKGVDFIFLYQGATKVDDRFQTIEEAEKHFRLDSCPHWDLTEYWFGFDRELNSWAMYDAFSGDLQFTPQGLTAGRRRPAADYAGVTFH